MKGQQMKLKAQFNITAWPKVKLNFWGIPKCGNTSMKYALLVNAGINGPKDGVMKWVHNHGGAKYIDIKTARSNGFQNVTITRDPYERFVSMYKDILRRPKMFKFKCESIDHFIQALTDKKIKDASAMHFKPQTDYIAPNNEVIPDTVFDLDHLDKNFMNLNIEKHNSIEKDIILTPDQKIKIYELYRKDFVLLGYNV